ncbi:MAG: hypothetical protein K9M99_04680 [Candidatus Cloacimonetes bacterium]|nr:hypothetical protein [Candidatus Cloacimonadota bacterium]
MRQFDKYLQDKLKNKEFCQAYNDNCNICQTVWEIVDTFLNTGKSYADLAVETGISETELLDFAEGDNCQAHIINTLCQKFNIPLPAYCPRFTF